MFIRTAFLAAALAVSSQAFAVEHLTPKEADAEATSGKIVLVDIRTPGEWAQTGVAPNATPLDMTSSKFSEDLGSLIAANPDKMVTFICRSGQRSGRLAQILEANGLQNIADVKGGMNEWVNEGLPVKKP
jgi:rhodanese-related sulfurtransferase